MVGVPVVRGNGTEPAVFTLGFVDVKYPLVVEQFVPEDEALAEASGGPVAEPAHALVALGAVRRHSAVIAPDAPVGVAVDRIEDLIGALEAAGGGHSVIHHLALEGGGLGDVVESGDLGVAESVIDEFRLPAESAVLRGGVSVGHLCRAEVRHIERVRCGQGLGETHRHGGVLVRAQVDLEPAHHVLSHVHYHPAVRAGVDGHGGEALVYLEAGGELLAEFLAGGGNDVGGLPAAVLLISGLCPLAQFEAGVILFAVEFIVRDYGTLRGGLPAAVGAYDLGLAVAVFHLYLGEQARHSEHYGRGLAHSHIAAVAELHAYRIGAFAEHPGDVVGEVVAGLPVPGRVRAEHVVAHRPAVDVADGGTQATDAQGGLLDASLEFELMPEVAGGEPGGSVVGEVEFLVHRDPVRCEPGRIHRDAEFHGSGTAPAAFAVPYRHFPEVGLAGFRSGAAVGDVDGYARCYFPAVPQQLAAGLEVFGLLRHGYAVGFLEGALRALHLPAEAHLAGLFCEVGLGVDGGCPARCAGAGSRHPQCEDGDDDVSDFHISL